MKMKQFFYTDGKETFGPFSEIELKRENLSRDTKVWFYGLDDWTSLSEIAELSAVINSIPPDLPSSDASTKEIKTKETLPPLRQPKRENRNWYNWIIPVAVILIVGSLIYIKFYKSNDRVLYEAISENSFETDFDFQVYIDKFYRDIGVYGIYPKKPKTTIVRFSNLDQMDNTTHLHGVSFGYENDDLIEIYINPSSWANFNKPKRYYLMYHELAHDILNVDDLSSDLSNEGKLMYPAISSYESISMDDFIESSHALFEEFSAE